MFPFLYDAAETGSVPPVDAQFWLSIELTVGEFIRLRTRLALIAITTFE